jgi:heme exporter protein A
VEAALRVFVLDALADIPAGYLSAGQKRRLALARLAAAERPLWLLDEPTVSLDAASVEVLIAAINAHLKSGGMAVIATHVPMALAPMQQIRLGRAVSAEAQP